MKYLTIVIAVLVLCVGCAAKGNIGPVKLECHGPAMTIFPDNPDYEIFRRSMFMRAGLVMPDGEGGPIQVTGGSFTLLLPLGSGREYVDGMRTLEGHACGQIDIPSIQQGEDRSQGLYGIFKDVMGT